MKNEKRKFISRVVGVVLSGVIGLTFFSGLSVGAEEAKNQSNITELNLANAITKRTVNA